MDFARVEISSKGRATPGCYNLADTWTLIIYQNMLYSVTEEGENSLQI